VVKQKPPPPRPVFDENSFAPPLESVPARPLAPIVSPSTAPVSQPVANVAPGADGSKPVGLLRKQPPSVQQAPPIVSDANIPAGTSNAHEPRVRFDTPADSIRPVSQVGNVPAAPPTQATIAPVGNRPPTAAPVMIPAPTVIQPAPPAVQPASQPNLAPAPPVSTPYVAPSVPTVLQQPPTIAPKPLQPEGFANIPAGGSAKAPVSTKPVRETPVVQPVPVVPSSAPVVTSDHNTAPHGSDPHEGITLVADPTGNTQPGRKPNVLKKAPPGQVQQDRVPAGPSVHAIPEQRLPVQDPVGSLSNVPGQPGAPPIRKGHATVDGGSHVQDPSKHPTVVESVKPAVMQPIPGSVNNMPTGGMTPEAALAERDRIAGTPEYRSA
jgi:hypothetical protein